MKSNGFTAISALMAAFISISLPLLSQAGDFPDKPITLVVPYSAGGGADNAARILAQALSQELKQSVVIENKGGASGSIGTSYVAHAAPNGYTMLYDASSFAINPVLRKLPYDAQKDFIPVSQAVSVPNIMVVAENSPFTSLSAFIAAAQKSPGKYTFASTGPGSLAQMIVELLKEETHIDIVHVPYKGGAPAIMDVIGHRVDIYCANAASSLNYISSHRLKALAVTSAGRMKEIPEVPTLAEYGLKDFNVLEWNGFFLPAGTPADIVTKLQEAIQNSLKKDAVRQKLHKLGLTPVGSSSVEFSAFIKSEIRQWQGVVAANHLSLQ